MLNQDRRQGARELEAECPQTFFQLSPGRRPDGWKNHYLNVLPTPVAPATGGASELEAKCLQTFFQLSGLGIKV